VLVVVAAVALLVVGVPAVGLAVADGGAASPSGTHRPSWAGHGGDHATHPRHAKNPKHARLGTDETDADEPEASRGDPPAQARRMQRLARRHAAGMRAWAACTAAGRDGCEKPLPPGLAKRR
jgi:hypothetical protein